MIKEDIRYIPKDRMSNVEVHVAHGCNLKCESCSHYSNHGHTGILSVNEIVEMMKPWSEKIKPKWLSLMGGEPTLNKNLVEIAQETSAIWKDTKIRIISNGFFLYRFPDLPSVLKANNIQLRVSIHHSGDKYQEEFKKINKLLQEWKSYGVEVVIKEDYKGWLRVYKGFGDQMMPFEDNNSKQSWGNCGVKWCKQLFMGKLWKCPNLAYLQMQDKKFNLDSKWDKYLTYREGDYDGQAIGPKSSYQQIKMFYETEEIKHCAMCPASGTANKFKLPCPLPSSNLVQITKK